MFRSRSWFAGGWGRPKNPHSLDHLKYLYNVLTRNQTVSEHNRELLVESLRCIAEILIWGDQNDSSVFDFFLEKNMLSYFLRIMRQRSGGSSFVCVQLLQTLNILFENIRHETSLYYLLSNNHVNSIIVHKFDFSDEEVMAYYISFLKTLSLKLNGHTIHFFYNEHTNDFPLYTEAIKFFNHPESMVRIAVRTLTLNVYRVQDASMLKFIRDRTAAPYFSNLVWFIGKHILELDSCVKNDANHQSQQKLDDLVAEHLDHLHYINDILCLKIPDLNDVLTEHLLHKLLIPLYIYSLTAPDSLRSRNVPRSPPYAVSSPKSRTSLQNIESLTKNLATLLNKNIDASPEQKNKNTYRREESIEEELKPRVSCVVALFLLSQVFLIITHEPIVQALAWIILQSDTAVFEFGVNIILESLLKTKKSLVKLEFSKPRVTLEMALETALPHSTGGIKTEIGEIHTTEILHADHSSSDLDPDLMSCSLPSTSHISESSSIRNSSEDLMLAAALIKSDFTTIHGQLSSMITDSNITDEEKEKLVMSKPAVQQLKQFSIDEGNISSLDLLLDKKPFLKTVLDSLDCSDNDYKALFALCLLYALISNKGVDNTELLSQLLSPNVTLESVKNELTTSRSLNTDTGDDILQQLTYNTILSEKLITIVIMCCQEKSRVRLVTLELGLRLLLRVSEHPSPSLVRRVEVAKQRAAALVRTFYKSDDLFLDMFEEEYCEMTKRPLNVEWLCMDAAILLPPTGTPMSGIAFTKRLPCGEIERARRAIRSYFLIRTSWLELIGETDQQLPLTPPNSYIKVGNILDLNNSDLLSCMITCADGTRGRRFMAVDSVQLILVEPSSRLGWGEAKLVGSLQDLEIANDKDDTRCLQLTIRRPPGSGGPTLSPRAPLLQAKFKFDDYIRCMAAKQRLTKSRMKLRQKKMQQIARLLEVPGAGGGNNTSMQSSSSLSLGGSTTRSAHRSLIASRAALIRRETPSVERVSNTATMESADRKPRRPSAQLLRDNSYDRTRSRDSSRGSKDGSPRPPRPRSEEIPLEDMRRVAADGIILPNSNSSIQIKERPQIPTVSEDLSHHSQSDEPEPNPRSNLIKQTSEETSFIADATKDNGRKKKGSIETV